MVLKSNGNITEHRYTKVKAQMTEFNKWKEKENKITGKEF